MAKNIIVLLLDTARAQDVYSNGSMPVIGRLAREGTD